MDQEGLFSVAHFYVRFWDAGLEVKNCVAGNGVSVENEALGSFGGVRIESEGFEDSVNFGILFNIFSTRCEYMRRNSDLIELRSLLLQGVESLELSVVGTYSLALDIFSFEDFLFDRVL